MQINNDITNQNSKPLLILYGSKLGNSKMVAKQAQHYYQSRGIDCECMSMKKYPAENLGNVGTLLMVVSTHGKGDPPPAAKKFFKFLMSSNMDQLTKLEYSVCALGDSSYKRFCKAGKDIDGRLKELGAKCFLARTDCDAKYSKQAMKWIKASYSNLYNDGVELETEENNNGLMMFYPPAMAEYRGKIVGKRKMSGEVNDDKACYHIEIKCEDKKLNYQPGDTIEVIPENPEQLVDEILSKLEISANKKVNRAGQTISDKLQKELEITKLSEPVMKKYQLLSRSEKLNLILKDPKELDSYLDKSNVLDLISDFPYHITSCDLEEVLAPISGRHYSIASSAEYCSNQLDLTVKTVRFNHKNTKREGAGSVYLTEKLNIDDQLNFKIHPNKDFRLPQKTKTRVIMIGIGTGIAPFRGFMQELQAQKVKSKSWLIWGERRLKEHYYYREELRNFEDLGVLKRKDIVFSRDGERVHVQDAIRNKADKLMKWISKGAHLYVCGSFVMGEQVKSTINEIIQDHQKKTKKKKGLKIESVEDLFSAEKYHEDLY